MLVFQLNVDINLLKCYNTPCRLMFLNRKNLFFDWRYYFGYKINM